MKAQATKKNRQIHLGDIKYFDWNKNVEELKARGQSLLKENLHALYIDNVLHHLLIHGDRSLSDLKLS